MWLSGPPFSHPSSLCLALRAYTRTGAMYLALRVHRAHEVLLVLELRRAPLGRRVVGVVAGLGEDGDRLLVLGELADRLDHGANRAQHASSAKSRLVSSRRI